MRRMRTTHVGSLPRPTRLLDLMKARASGTPTDEAEYEREVRHAVMQCVGKQAASGIDILNDGEQSKPGFFTYIRERLAGFEARPGRHCNWCDFQRVCPAAIDVPEEES